MLFEGSVWWKYTADTVGQVPDITMSVAGRVGDDRVQHGSFQREKTALDACAVLGLALCVLKKFCSEQHAAYHSLSLEYAHQITSLDHGSAWTREKPGRTRQEYPTTILLCRWTVQTQFNCATKIIMYKYKNKVIPQDSFQFHTHPYCEFGDLLTILSFFRRKL